jgi:hypothetical protein
MSKNQAKAQLEDQQLQDQSPRDVIKLVRMQRDPDSYPAPHRADVHPDEVTNYAAGGWVPVS